MKLTDNIKYASAVELKEGECKKKQLLCGDFQLLFECQFDAVLDL